MTIENRWLLPEGIEEVLPPQARHLEGLRRRLLDLYHSWGYELVVPPLIEYLESLLTGLGHDSDLRTFKLTDQLTGRLMGVRADMTPQVARIEAHHLKRDVPVRLCYLGSILQTRPDGPGGSRNPLQVGAELYGHGGVESDLEALQLMVETLKATGVPTPYLDLGHVGIYRGLIAQAGLTSSLETLLFAALQRKAGDEVVSLLRAAELPEQTRRWLAALVHLHGGVEILPQARLVLAGATPAVIAALDALEALAELASRYLPACPLHFDLAELRGYTYHTGVVFAAYIPGVGQAVATGGRYDGVGGVFGHPRPATGFSADLKTLVAWAPQPTPEPGAIYAPELGDKALEQRVQALRAQGERVIRALPRQQGEGQALGCDRLLQRDATGWQVVPLKGEK